MNSDMKLQSSFIAYLETILVLTGVSGIKGVLTELRTELRENSGYPQQPATVKILYFP